MPELPEVETVRRQLAPVLEGRVFEQVRIDDARLTRPFEPQAVAAELEGERVEVVDRRGKYLVVRFSTGRALLIHLRMTGSLRHARRGGLPDDPHRRAVVTLDDGSDVMYRDVRRFGTWHLAEPHDVESYLAKRLGPEPLSRAFAPAAFAATVAKRKAPIKAIVLDQKVVAGVGNIYADEALWRARIHPLRASSAVEEAEARALHRTIRQALEAGIKRQGATLRDYARPDGQAGRMQEAFKVYGRDGEPCVRCGTLIEKTRAGGRGTWFCPSCQR